MSAYFLAQITITDPDTYQKYLDGYDEIFSHYRGQVIAVDDAPTVLEGEFHRKRVVLVQFPDEQSLRAWYDSSAYQQLAQFRRAASEADLLVVHGRKPSVFSADQPNPSPGGKVELREISGDTVRTICRLAVRGDQEKFVAPNAVSIAQAHFSQHDWFRAIYADDIPVGFVMLEDQPDKPEYYLWRFMIDARYQGMGFGKQAIDLIVAHVRTRPNATELLTSVLQGEGGPQQFYEKLGFVLTGEYEEGEAIMRLVL